MLRNILIVGFGGSIGSIARYLCQKYIYELHPQPFPFGTLLVNVLGCFLIGLFFGISERGNFFDTEARLLLMAGFCGGFTTFSAFALENINLLKTGHFAYFGIYTSLSLILGIGAVWLGTSFVKLF